MAGLSTLSARPFSCASHHRAKTPFFVPQRRYFNCYFFSKLPWPAQALLPLAPPFERSHSVVTPRASVGNVEHAVEPGTRIKFPKELQVPGSSSSMILLGTGYREKVFAIIGVKVYAAGFYAESPIQDSLSNWKGKSSTELIKDSSLFSSIFHAPLEKSLNILLVRDVDGKTFWNALNDVISPRIKNTAADDESAISTFRNTFQGRDLKQGTCILLTWVETSKMLISISSTGLPADIDAEIRSMNVNWALYDGFFGGNPVSPTLKASVVAGLTMMLS